MELSEEALRRSGAVEESEESDSARASDASERSERAQASSEESEGPALGEDDLTPEEQDEVKQLRERDAEVRRHEEAHASRGGQYAGSPTYEYTRGPDGKRYAVAGQVMIDVTPIPGDPDGTIRKMTQVRSAALAPAEPSDADRAVASDAQQKIAEAKIEKSQMAAEQAEQSRQDRQGESSPAASEASGGQSPSSELPSTESSSAAGSTPSLSRMATRAMAGYRRAAEPAQTGGELQDVA